jgi:hypothetical protein
MPANIDDQQLRDLYRMYPHVISRAVELMERDPDYQPEAPEAPEDDTDTRRSVFAASGDYTVYFIGRTEYNRRYDYPNQMFDIIRDGIIPTIVAVSWATRSPQTDTKSDISIYHPEARISGSIVCAVFDRSSILTSYAAHLFTASAIPASFDMRIIGQNEYGLATYKDFREVRVISEAQGVSVDDITSDQQYTFAAEAMTPWIPTTGRME